MQTNLTMPEPSIPVPIRTDEYGRVLIGNTRVTLDLVIHQFQKDETPEAIQQHYDTLTLDEIYAVITYYLQNRTEVDAYMREVEAAEEQARREWETNPNEVSRALREKLRQEKQKRAGIE